MSSKASSKHSSRSMEVGRPKLKDEPHLSGAYIRSLVKQLSSSRSREPMIPKSPDIAYADGSSQNLAKFSSDFSESQQQPPQPQQPKKQVRRRLHTIRPYQERLLNMAEARREIVTALKFHRAAMKQASEKQQKHQLSPPGPPPPIPPPPPHVDEPHKEKVTWKNPGTYPSTTASLFSYFNSPSLQSIPYPPFPCAYSSVSPPPVPESLNQTLPIKPLGLNLNFHGFTNMDTIICDNCTPPIPSSASSSSSCSYSSSSPPLTTTATSLAPDVPLALNGVLQASEATSHVLHLAMDEKEMAEIRLIGEQHDMEWNDKLNLVTSAWWCKFLETMELESSGSNDTRAGAGGEGEVGHHFFEEVLDVSSWLSDQQHFCNYN